MDIRDKLLETVDANDPNFKVLLNNAIQAEILALEEELAAKRELNEQKRVDLKSVLERRKNLKKSIKEKTELNEVLEPAINCLQDYSLHLLKTLTLTRDILDEDSLRELAIIEEEEKMLEKLEKKCLEYEAEFEKDPLAQQRKAARQELQKIEINIKMTEMSIKDMKRNFAIHKNVQEKREQQQIIELAKLMLNYRKHLEENKQLKQEETELKLKIAEQEIEIQGFIKQKTNMEKSNAIARFLMPPPIMDKKIVETIFPSQGEKSIPESMVDTLNDNASISSSIYEEMCSIPEKMIVETPGTDQPEPDPEVVSLASTCDIQRNSENSEASLQSFESISKKGDNSGVKRKSGKIVSKKPEASRRPMDSPRINPVHKKTRNDNFNPNNVPKGHIAQQQSSAKLGAVKKVRRNSQAREKNFSAQDASISERREISDRGVTQEQRLVQERREIPERRVIQEQRAIPERRVVQERREIPERRDFSEDSLTTETVVPGDAADYSENLSTCESVNSFIYDDTNANEIDPNAEIYSEISFQSNNEDQNNSILFTPPGSTATGNNIAESELNVAPPETPAPMTFGIFGAQNRGALNFQGLFFK